MIKKENNNLNQSVCHSVPQNDTQYGRSMVEMLGVLAVMGVLSVASVA